MFYSVIVNPLSYVYDRDPAAVLALLTDPEFLKQRCAAMGEKNVQVEARREGDSVTIETRRDVERPVPGFAKKLFSPTNHVRQVETWRTQGDGATGSYQIEIKGAPISIRATMTLRPHARGAEYTITYDVTARVPLLGKKLAAYTLDQTIAGARKEMDYTAAALARG